VVLFDGPHWIRAEPFSAAIVTLDAALRSHPSDEQAQTPLGLSYYGAHGFADAGRYLSPLAMSAPAMSNCIVRSHKVAYGQENIVAQWTNFYRLSERTPHSAATDIFMGEALDGLGRTSQAVTEFEAAGRFLKPNPKYISGWAICIGSRAQYEKASRV
jgi:hypothetical protein